MYFHLLPHTPRPPPPPVRLHLYRAFFNQFRFFFPFNSVDKNVSPSIYSMASSLNYHLNNCESLSLFLSQIIPVCLSVSVSLSHSLSSSPSLSYTVIKKKQKNVSYHKPVFSRNSHFFSFEFHIFIYLQIIIYNSKKCLVSRSKVNLINAH